MVDQVDLHVGTLSKAAGAHGGFVACRSDLRSLLVTRGRAGVFSTALPAPAVAAAATALRVAAEARLLGARDSRCCMRFATLCVVGPSHIATSPARCALLIGTHAGVRRGCCRICRHAHAVKSCCQKPGYRQRL